MTPEHDEWCVADHSLHEEPALNGFDIATVVVCLVTLVTWYLFA